MKKVVYLWLKKIRQNSVFTNTTFFENCVEFANEADNK